MALNIDVPRAYLEMARAISDVLNAEMEKWSDDPPDEDDERMANIQFSLVSTIIIQCYMTIEAFVNEGLYDLWNKSREYEKDQSHIETNGTTNVLNVKSRYHQFYTKYGHYDNFEELKKESELRNLGDRINIICDTRDIDKICDSDSKTWTLFRKMEKEYRHFLIHIHPENQKFHDLVNDILINNEIRIYFETVQNVISHFYNQNDNTPPEWLTESELFNFSGINYL